MDSASASTVDKLFIQSEAVHSASRTSACAPEPPDHIEEDSQEECCCCCCTEDHNSIVPASTVASLDLTTQSHDSLSNSVLPERSRYLIASLSNPWVLLNPMSIASLVPDGAHIDELKALSQMSSAIANSPGIPPQTRVVETNALESLVRGIAWANINESER